MPFPTKAIKEAYENSVSIMEGYFKDEPGLLYVNDALQKTYQEVIDGITAEKRSEIDTLLECQRMLHEYECYHEFTEGWRMARERIKRED